MRICLLLPLLMLSGLSCQPFSLRAQTTLSLEEAVLMAQRHSPAAREAFATWQVAEARYRLALADRGPGLALTATLPGLNRQIEPLILDNGTQSFITRSQSYSYTSLQARQPLPFTGGALYLSSGLHFIHNLGQPNSSFWQTTPLLVEWQQPLFQPNGYRWDRQLAESARQHASLLYRVAMESLAQETRSRFFDALGTQLAARQARLALQTLDTLATIARQRYSLGSTTEGDWLQIRQQQLQAAGQARQLEQQSLAATIRLAQLLGHDSQELPALLPPSEPGSQPFDWELLRQRMTVHAASLNDNRLQSLHLARNLAETQAKYRVRADLVMSLGLNQTGRNMQESYKAPQWRQFGTVAVQVPLVSSGRKQAGLAILHHQHQALEAEAARQELDLEASFNKLEADWTWGEQQLARAAEIEAMAQRVHQLAVQRYLLGRGTLMEVLLAMQSLETAREAHFQALANRWLALGELRLLTLYDPRFDQPLPWPASPQP